MPITLSLASAANAAELTEALERLVPQLSRSNPSSDRQQVVELLESGAVSQFVARSGDGRIVGVSTLAVFRIPTGLRARIEDVITDEATRGQGVGEALTRSLPGVAEIGGPALVACMGDPARFERGKQFRRFTGLTPKASETGDTDRKGQARSRAGSSLLRTTMVRAADTARKQDPQLARLCWVQMVERGKDHLGANCVAATNLAERAWTVMHRGTPYVICDTDGRPVTADEAKAIIAEHWTVPAEVRARRRSKKVGKVPQNVLARDNRSHALEAPAHGATFPSRHRPPPPTRPSSNSSQPALDSRSSIGNQPRLSPTVHPVVSRSSKLYTTSPRWLI